MNVVKTKIGRHFHSRQGMIRNKLAEMDWKQILLERTFNQEGDKVIIVKRVIHRVFIPVLPLVFISFQSDVSMVVIDFGYEFLQMVPIGCFAPIGT